jgi:hypothetical protein
MAYRTYLDITNGILSELNEVQLTSANFSTAKGIQQFVKDSVNRAYFDLVNENPESPWLSTVCADEPYGGNEFVDTVVGQRWYFLRKNSSGSHGTAKDFSRVDWDHFYLTTDEVGTCSVAGVCSNPAFTTAETCVAAGNEWTDYDTEEVCTAAGETWTATHSSPHTRRKLKFITIEQWHKHYRESDDDSVDTGSYTTPVRVVMSPCGRKFGLSPMPDKVYRIFFYAWDQVAELSAYDDQVLFPHQWITVLSARARYYVWQFKENAQLAALALEEYKRGLKLMRDYSGRPQTMVMSDDRIRYV